MNRHVWAALVLLFQFSPSLFAQDTSSPGLIGRWKVESFSYAGYEVRSTKETPMTVVISQDSMLFDPAFHYQYNWNFGVSAGTGFQKETSVSIHFSDKPVSKSYRARGEGNAGEIDIEVKADPSKDKKFGQGIYRRDGDQLELSIGDPGYRPDSIKATNRSYVLRLTKLPE